MAEEAVVSQNDPRDSSPPPPPPPLALTQDQKERIATQKQLALARRSANQRYHQSSQLVPAALQSVSQIELLPQWRCTQGPQALPAQHRGMLEEQNGRRMNVSDDDYAKQGYEEKAVAKRAKHMEIIDVEENSGDEYRPNFCKFQEHQVPGSESATKVNEWNRARIKSIKVSQSGGTRPAEWRSVRKRTISGHGYRARVASFSGGSGLLMTPQHETIQGVDAEDGFEGREFESSQINPVQTKVKLDKERPTTSSSGIFVVGKKADKISLSSHQVKVLKAISQGKSVFITGSAGTGKSFLLEFAVRVLKRAYGAESVFVTASTGLAACALGGTTLHSFAGVGLGLGSKVALADKASSKRDVRKRWMDAKALIIDEISMIDGELFDKLEYVASVVRKPLGHSKVFGGLQLIVTGDFFQLPPVSPENPQKYFAFDADCWNRCFDIQIEFSRVFRQSDLEFVGMLNELRKGYCSSTTLERLLHCVRPVDDPETGITLTRLYPRKVDVSKENEQNLNALNKETFAFLAKDVGQSDFAMRQLENVRAEKVLHLCVGAQVMLVKNLETIAGLVNGARGVIVRFISVDDPSTSEFKGLASSVSPDGVWPVVRFASDKVERVVGPESWTVMEGNREIAKRSQIPLILAWALSVHKCQGMTLDRVETDLSRAFDYGMIYVALSRVKSLDGLRLIGFDPSRIKVHPKVVQFYEGLKTDDCSQTH